MTYPNGRVLNDNYGTSNSMPDAMCRIASLIDDDGTTHLADYSYLGGGLPSPASGRGVGGEGFIIDVAESQPALDYTLVGTAGGNDPDTGDIYRGLDRFGRVKDLVWWNSGTSANAVRIQHGYDRASNRLWRADLVAEASSAGFDELYGYDRLYRVGKLNRGTLNSTQTAITTGTGTFGQCWTLDATGNWKGFREDDSGSGTWDLVQSRTANTVNEITGISNTTGPAWNIPAYDGNGNMKDIPQPESPTTVFLGTYDAWNRLVKLVDAIGDTIEQYAYDGLRRRTMKQNPGAAETRDYYYSSAWQVLEERVGGSSDAERQFTWGLRYIDDLILRDRDTNGDGTMDERMFALQDPNWNVVGLTDSSGDIQERYSYDAYGLPTVLTATYGSRSSSSYAWETLYAGYRYDATTGLYLVRNRILNPRTGTWGQRDVVNEPIAPNQYEVSFANPVRFIDSSGLWPQELAEGETLLPRQPVDPAQAAADIIAENNRFALDLTDTGRWAAGNTAKGMIGFQVASPFEAVIQSAGKAADNTTVIAMKLKDSGRWIMRLDTPHGGSPFYHLNADPKGIPGLGTDPHMRIWPPCGTANDWAPGRLVKWNKGLRTAGKCIRPIAIASDVVGLGEAIAQDAEQGGYRNATGMGGDVAGGWAGAAGGAWAGAKAGAVIGVWFGGPLGASIGAAGGSLIGAIGGSFAGSALGRSGAVRAYDSF